MILLVLELVLDVVLGLSSSDEFRPRETQNCMHLLIMIMFTIHWFPSLCW